MRKLVIVPACCQPKKATQLIRILRRCGAYYHSAELLYQEFWKQRLVNIGLRVLLVEKEPYHEVWRNLLWPPG